MEKALLSGRSLTGPGCQPSSISISARSLGEHCDLHRAEPGGRKATYHLVIPQGTQAVRFDPIEGSQVTIRELQVILDGQVLNIQPANGERKDGIDWFETTDPQYEIAVPDVGKILVIELEMQVK
jgi:hypothetical protein